MAKVENGETTTYTVAVLGLSQVLVETSGGESIVYLYGHDLLAEEGAAWAWHLSDGLGSVRQLVDGDGDVTLAQGYTPFGVPLWDEGSAATGYGFTGERWEAYSGLLFLRARYYEPGTGRFFTRDPWQGDPLWPRTLHGYSYVLNNPVNASDPSGQRSPHIVTQLWYAYSYWMIPEYRVPGTAPDWMPEWAKRLGWWWGSRVDLLDPWAFEIYEVEPRWGAKAPGHGLEQVTRYIGELNAANAFFMNDWKPGTRATRQMRVPWDLINDLVADLEQPGLIVYWYEPNPERVKVLVEVTCFSWLAHMMSEGVKNLESLLSPKPAPAIIPIFPPPCFFDPIHRCRPAPVS